ncbi:MAG: response regulator [Pseudomonadota bacterium]
MSIRARLALGLAPSLLGLAVVGGIALARIEAVETDERWVAHTHEVLQRATLLGKTIAEAESNARAYRLTGQRPFLDEYRRLRQSWRADLAELRMLVRDHPLQIGRLEQLDAALPQRVRAMDELVDQAVRSGNGRAPASLQAQSQQLGEDVRRVLDAFVQTERALLRERSEQADRTSRLTRRAVTGTAALSFLVTLLMLMGVARSINRPLARLQTGALRVAEGDYESDDLPEGEGEIGQVARSFNRMKAEVALRERRLSEQDWINSRLAEFFELFQAPPDLPTLCGRTVSQLARTLSLPYLVLYVREDGPHGPYLSRCAAFAGQGAPERIAAGEGLVGQCLEDGRLLEVHPVPEGHVRITTAAGSSPVAQVLVVPALYEREVKAVFELGLSSPATAAQRHFLERFAQSFGLVLNALRARVELEAALERAMRLSESLQHKQEELTRANAELHQQADQLRASEQLLREQQEQLRRANDEYEQANAELRETGRALQEQARQLAEASEYKSQFLASMSHELRTPLNSVLILSQLLAENPQGTLTDKQVEYARTIHGAGQDLLELINDILDLAKIESGALRVDWEPVTLDALLHSSEAQFRPLAERKGLVLRLRREQEAPPRILSDAQRVWQIVKNLLSNALKFTERGEVEMTVRAAEGPGGVAGVALAVRDTGIGIAPQLHERIFESFQQGDRGTARKYGGTGLGLAISRRLARLLGGELSVRSAPGQGSTFTLWLPLSPAGAPMQDEAATDRPAPGVAPLPATSRTVVAVHRDPGVVDRLREVAAERGFETVAVRLDEVVEVCERLWPALIVLEAEVEQGRGWVMLGLLKQRRATRHVPVLLACADDERERAVRLGAAHTLGPSDFEGNRLRERLHPRLDLLARSHRTVLVVEDDPAQQRAILELLADPEVQVRAVGTAAEALKAMEEAAWDCVVLDLGLPDMDGIELVAQMRHRFGGQSPPVVVYTGRELSKADADRLERVSDAIIIKGVRSPERLLAETSLLLHRVEARMPEHARAMIERGHLDDPVLAGRRVLVVDDDMRNIFSIAAALEAYGVEVVHAEGGQEALDLLDRTAPVDAVLMDIMMPGMDGLEAMRRLRADPRWRSLPILAITAKAMPGDRERCLQAGASDYLTKPLDMDRLRALLRVWLVRPSAAGGAGDA